ncbi:hypothetical protein A2721_00155 [Candidatus Gottesmanbacteria bacterium RIFCSPHIGHO2_01_FULL_47_48]|uniref:Uncharacterized protein n=1 Tax=Candidatus Gottesmanbacteria bacterium RIFCSPHIGHO2_01_FULL_47_48 TaxID=1798381 RepID=A0A1F6A3N8_9BACT|nr:MAG: hypothetical protein A2721_00155 [Candidatus Gottesmanbacteria bacterium RIFCSPHIGHO2_01_FULL_47_48]
MTQGKSTLTSERVTKECSKVLPLFKSQMKQGPAVSGWGLVADNTQIFRPTGAGFLWLLWT